jgi:hypothetical protein
MEFVRAIVKTNVSLQKVDSLAWDENWYLHNFIPPTEEDPYEKIWKTQDEQATIHYIEDSLIDIRYFLVEGKSREEVLEKIRSSLETFERYEIIEMIKTAVEPIQYVHAIYHVGVAATQKYDPEFFEIFKAAFSHSDVKVRNAAILSTGYVGWQEFQEPLELLKTSDPDPIVREFAAYTLESLAKHNWKESIE